jgi:tetratricopeptide (TPR) repeat protein
MKSNILNRPFIHILFLIVLSFFAYSNTFDVPFQFDGKFGIANSPLIKDLESFFDYSKAKLYKGHFGYYTFKQRYIGYLTFALNYKLHGLNVAGYHLLNLFIHIGTSLLLYLLVILSFQTPFLRSSSLKNYAPHIAVFSALLFACHPLQTQAVTYIWQRVTSLATMLYLLSLTAYVRWRLINHNTEERQKTVRPKSVLWYLTAVVAAVLAMKTKEITFMLPLSIVLYEFLFFQGPIARRTLFLVPLFCTMLIIPLTLISIIQPAGQLIDDVSDITRGHTSLSRWQYLMTSSRVMVTYLRLLFFPVNQNLYHDYPVYASFLDTEVLLSFLFLASILGLGILLLLYSRHREPSVRLISFGIFWFFINLTIESSIIPLSNVIYEHRVYLSSIGIFLALTTALFLTVEKLRIQLKRMEWAMVGLLLIVVLALTGATYARNGIWKTEISIWQDVISKSPKSYMGYYNVGSALQSRGLNNKAIEYLQTAIKLKSDYPSAHYNLGLAYRTQNRIDKAIQHYLTAINLQPDYPKALNNLGNAYIIKGQIDKAIEEYRKALQLVPYSPDTNVNLGNAYMMQGKVDQAIEGYRKALQISPEFYEAHYNLAVAYRAKGLNDKAIEHLQAAKSLRKN